MSLVYPHLGQVFPKVAMTPYCNKTNQLSNLLTVEVRGFIFADVCHLEFTVLILGQYVHFFLAFNASGYGHTNKS